MSRRAGRRSRRGCGVVPSSSPSSSTSSTCRSARRPPLRPHCSPRYSASASLVAHRLMLSVDVRCWRLPRRRRGLGGLVVPADALAHPRRRLGPVVTRQPPRRVERAASREMRAALHWCTAMTCALIGSKRSGLRLCSRHTRRRQCCPSPCASVVSRAALSRQLLLIETQALKATNNYHGNRDIRRRVRGERRLTRAAAPSPHARAHAASLSRNSQVGRRRFTSQNQAWWQQGRRRSYTRRTTPRQWFRG